MPGGGGTFFDRATMKAVGPFEVPHLDDVERTWGEVFASDSPSDSPCPHTLRSARRLSRVSEP